MEYLNNKFQKMEITVAKNLGIINTLPFYFILLHIIIIFSMF